MTEDADGVLLLELATRVLAPASGTGPRIHLVAAVHVADASFYAARQAELDARALVLYEGVKPAGTSPVDPAAHDAEKAAATRRRLELLRAMLLEHHALTGSLPATPAPLVEEGSPARREILRNVLADGWGRPLRYLRRPPAEGAAPAVDAATFTSDGPDGRPGTAEAPGDDLSVEVSAAPGGGSGQGKGPGLQAKLAAALGLAFQLDAMDTGGARWRCSDMGMDELQARFEKAGVDAAEFLAFLEGTSELGRMAGRMLDFIAKAPKMGAYVKLLLVEMMGSGAAEAMGEGGKGQGLPGFPGGDAAAAMKVILVDRNGVVMEDLRAILAREPGTADVGVFYGAAHMKDLERRIAEEFGYRAEETTWTAAMRADPRDAGFTPEQARNMRKAMRKMLEGLK